MNKTQKASGAAGAPGVYIWHPEMGQPSPSECDFRTEGIFDGHYLLWPLHSGVPHLHGRGIKWDERCCVYTVTKQAYDKLKMQYRIAYKAFLD